jgi:methionine synthase II (cobalamin-independent)
VPVAKIHKDILIEDLVRVIPQSVAYLRHKQIKCLACGEPIWGTLEEEARRKGLGDADIAQIVLELNEMCDASSSES